MSKKAILYARVSTDDQADKGYSLPSQIEAMRRYAQHQGFEVVAEFREDISGALPITERPEGKKLTTLIKTQQVNAIVAHQVDRLYRDNVELLIAVRMWLRAGIEVHTCDIGKIEDENNIILLIKGWQGSDERKKSENAVCAESVPRCKPAKSFVHVHRLVMFSVATPIAELWH